VANARIVGGRPAVGVVCSLLALCLVFQALWTAPTTGAETGGAISGEVTDASTRAPIAGIEVCAASTVVEVEGQEEGEGEGHSRCTTTGAGGGYTLSGLASGNFYVEFRAASRALDYVPQFYNGKPAAAEAEQVSVSAGQTTTGINAALEQGGQISGSVTDASTGAPLTFVAACAVALGGRPATEEVPCAITDAKGVYTIPDLAGGSYAVEFIDLRYKYQKQFYDGKSSLGSANAVGVSPPKTTPGIDAALQRSGARPPAANGGPPTPGPTGNTEASRSPLAMGFAVIIRSPRIIVRRGLALVQLECHATCRGKLALLATRWIRHGHKKLRRTVSIGSASFAAGAGRAVTVKIRVDSVGRALLENQHGRLVCRLMISQLMPGPARTKYSDVHLVGRHA